MPGWAILLLLIILAALWVVWKSEEPEKESPSKTQPLGRPWEDSRFSIKERFERDLPIPVWHDGMKVWLMPEDPAYTVLRESLLGRR